MKKSELAQIIKEELGKVLSEAPNRQAAMRKGVTSNKIKGGITKHFNDYKGTETYNSVRELEDVLMYYAQDPSQPLDLDEIANTVLDIIDYAVEEAIDNYKQSRDEF